MDILIDTNFAITCAKQKIDFFNLIHEIAEGQICWIVPKNVLEEIKKISTEKGRKTEDRKAAFLFLDIFESTLANSFNVNLISLKRENVDDALAEYCTKNPPVILATLDKKLGSRVKNRRLTIKGKKFLKII